MTKPFISTKQVELTEIHHKYRQKIDICSRTSKQYQQTQSRLKHATLVKELKVIYHASKCCIKCKEAIEE
ncbi:hypothetical protein SESBI_38374 [Sesbania bispinosa]|nr:hypothetical protein SESBI_38374 [Sesbania bispinosa]